MLNHIALAGGRVTVSLSALHMGLSPLKVGTLLAVFAVLPMLFSVKAGRWIDRIGAYRPLTGGTGLIILGTAFPAIVPSQITLLVASCCIGIGFMLNQLATQNVLGQAGQDTRLRYFSWMSLALALSGFAGPLLGGVAFDHLGNDVAFALLGLGPLMSMIGLVRLRRSLRGGHTVPLPEATPRKIRELLALPGLRRILWVNTILSGAWDSHLFMVPLFGVGIGLSGTTIGIILATFAAATFVIRLLLPLLQRRIRSWTLIRISMATAAADFMVYPFFDEVAPLMGLSFVLGLALGICQPSILALVHQYAPPGRAAEAIGLRMALINGSQMSLPLAFGGLGTLVGISPLFCGYAVVLAALGWLNRNPPVDTGRAP
jgi:MFS family permease